MGEDPNDSGAIVELVRGIRPELKHRVEKRRFVPTFSRDAKDFKRKRSAEELQGFIDSGVSNGKPVVAVLVHQDADERDDEGRIEAALERELAVLEPPGVPVVPVEEIESWWLAFPDQTESIRQAWRNTLERSPRQTDAITDPKRHLQQRTRARRKSGGEYQEGDSVQIARAIRDAMAAPSRPSASYSRFVARVEALRV